MTVAVTELYYRYSILNVKHNVYQTIYKNYWKKENYVRIKQLTMLNFLFWASSLDLLWRLFLVLTPNLLPIFTLNCKNVQYLMGGATHLGVVGSSTSPPIIAEDPSRKGALSLRPPPPPGSSAPGSPDLHRKNLTSWSRDHRDILGT